MAQEKLQEQKSRREDVSVGYVAALSTGALIVLLVGLTVLLYAAPMLLKQPQLNSSSLSKSSSLLTASNTSQEAKATLDSDLDNDGQYDTIPHPVAGWGVVLAVLSIEVVLSALVGGRLVLALGEMQQLLSVWLVALERPG